MTPTEPSTPEFNAHELAGKLEWLAKDIRGKHNAGKLTPDYVADQLMGLVLELDTTVAIEGKSVELPVVYDDPWPREAQTDRRNARITLQAERAAQEIERHTREIVQLTAPRSLWARIFGR